VRNIAQVDHWFVSHLNNGKLLPEHASVIGQHLAMTGQWQFFSKAAARPALSSESRRCHPHTDFSD
jgi:hypothetical protein